MYRELDHCYRPLLSIQIVVSRELLYCQSSQNEIKLGVIHVEILNMLLYCISFLMSAGGNYDKAEERSILYDGYMKPASSLLYL